MVSTIATVVIAVAAASGPGPIAASLARHANDAIQQQTADDLSWSRLERIRRGVEVVVATQSGGDVHRIFLGHDSSTLMLLNANYAALPHGVADRLRGLAETRPDLFEPDRLAVGFVERDLRISGTGVFLGPTRLCDLDRIVERIPRDQIRLVKSSPEAHASQRAVITGVVVGAAVGVAFWASAIECRIADSITGCRLQLFAPVWMPVAGGAIGYAASRRVTEEVYYRHD